MDTTSVIYIGTLNTQLVNLKLYLTIVTNSNDSLLMSQAEIDIQKQKEQDEHEKVEKLFGRLNPEDFRQCESSSNDWKCSSS